MTLPQATWRLGDWLMVNNGIEAQANLLGLYNSMVTLGEGTGSGSGHDQGSGSGHEPFTGDITEHDMRSCT